MEPVAEDPLPPGPTIEAARSLLREGRPFSAHEVFEARWKDAPEGERDLWQGMAQLCVGSTHRERGNAKGAHTLWSRARARLGSYATTGEPTYGLDLAGLVGWLDERLADLERESAGLGGVAEPGGGQAAPVTPVGRPPI